MKFTAYLLLAFSLVFFGACNNDDDIGGPTGDNVLNYDAENFSAPLLPTGVYEAAVRFPASITSDFIGRQLVAIEFFLTNVPPRTEIGVFEQGTSSAPGTLVYEANVSGNASVNTWNNHTLNTPIEITGEDIWISVLVDHPSEIQTIGCDPGPAQVNGDYIYDYSTSTWSTLRSWSGGEVDINWNIRAILSN